VVSYLFVLSVDDPFDGYDPGIIVDGFTGMLEEDEDAIG
jgi:hypothetical protein